MRNVIRYNKKSREILLKIKKDISKLVEVNENNSENFGKLKTSVNNIHHELVGLDNIFRDGEYEKQVGYVSARIEDESFDSSEDELLIKKKIVIRKSQYWSDGFWSWFFTNKDL